MKDEDSHAFAAPPGQGTTPPGAQRHRVWPWLLLGRAGLVLLLAAARATSAGPAQA